MQEEQRKMQEETCNLQRKMQEETSSLQRKMQEERDDLESQITSLEEQLSLLQAKYRGNMQEINDFKSEKESLNYN